MTKFNQCPNCGKKPTSGAYMKIYKCNKCGKLYCHMCGGDYCPDCGSKERREIGEVWR